MVSTLPCHGRGLRIRVPSAPINYCSVPELVAGGGLLSRWRKPVVSSSLTATENYTDMHGICTSCSYRFRRVVQVHLSVRTLREKPCWAIGSHKPDVVDWISAPATKLHPYVSGRPTVLQTVYPGPNPGGCSKIILGSLDRERHFYRW